ncbi:uncharacterized protein I206_100828 [Kwoniella pini CBS 10737]|uniref:Uncharacterized protein n=1 Tax=Kwoniella pini CBS 10737 TaxID=1296096 RepID=A0A1B9IC16_9TREE|nr:uncharacterized protein I206_00499 [Kwoniella pini CBS 10737]OCF53198.1 hypothetical protein I206_00499 [Kwoniella pini CBS 10737]
MPTIYFKSALLKVLLIFTYLLLIPQTFAQTNTPATDKEDDDDDAKDCEYNGSVSDYLSCTKNKISTPMLIGAGVGIALGIFLISFLCIFLTRKKRKRIAQIDEEIDQTRFEFIQDGLNKDPKFWETKEIEKENINKFDETKKVTFDIDDNYNLKTQNQNQLSEENKKDHIIHLYSNKGDKSNKLSFQLLDPPKSNRPSILSNSNHSLKLKPSIIKDELNNSNQTQLKNVPSIKRPIPISQNNLHHSINGSIFNPLKKLNNEIFNQKENLSNPIENIKHDNQLNLNLNPNSNSKLNSRSGSPIPYNQNQFNLEITNPSNDLSISRENSIFLNSNHISRRFSTINQIQSQIEKSNPTYQGENNTKRSMDDLPKSNERFSSHYNENNFVDPKLPSKVIKSHKPFIPLRGYSKIEQEKESPTNHEILKEKHNNVDVNGRSGTFGPPKLYPRSRQNTSIIAENENQKTDSPNSSPFEVVPIDMNGSETEEQHLTAGDDLKKESISRIGEDSIESISTEAKIENSSLNNNDNAKSNVLETNKLKDNAPIENNEDISAFNSTVQSEIDKKVSSEESLIRSGTISVSRRKQLRNTNLIPSYYVKHNPLDTDQDVEELPTNALHKSEQKDVEVNEKIAVTGDDNVDGVIRSETSNPFDRAFEQSDQANVITETSKKRLAREKERMKGKEKEKIKKSKKSKTKDKVKG